MKKNNSYHTLYGLNNVLAILKTDQCSIVRIEVITGSRIASNKSLIKNLKKTKTPFFQITKDLFKKKYLYSRSQGIAISFYYDLNKRKVPKSRNKKNVCFLVLDQIKDPQNFGQIIRTAECAGVDGIIYSKHNSSPITDTVLQVSQGAFLNVPLYEVVNVKNEIAKMKKQGFWSIGIENDLDASNWYEIDYRNKIIIVFGSEGEGIRQKVLDMCDFKGTIKMQGKINSLNVSASISAILFERLRQLRSIN